ncbi:MAG TPA: thiol-disulfide oxidoreductase DCC family protein [Pelobium sp.]|nr:thiol-disulfide oxidoreductase DCC family protein [Pelobium sp.]
MEKHGIILFDGVCNLCDGFVQRIIAADQKDFFRFASLQSEEGSRLLAPYPDLKDMKSIVYLENGKVYTKANAALKISTHLGGSWKLLKLSYIVPNFLRNGIYDLIAKNRYKWFGKKDQCMIPTEELKAKFL